MSDLFIYGKKINTFFDILGSDEDDITKSIAWVLCNNKIFLVKLLDKLLPNSKYNIDNVIISSQDMENNTNPQDDNSRTDIQIYELGNFRIIIEAKKGWNLPNPKKQLKKYVKLF